ncbi:hypothetical protein [Andreprevotia chitinilytica]|uniref:hypothetical protein n=1 Tax=Andreprevotia chitinilytica TaxID=396808 RepID=UPI00068E364F|nr:hypothetical protein [Andreprevotia chitinilytica]
MSKLNRESILAAQDCITETVPVPEWGGEITVTEMTGEQSSRFWDEAFTHEGGRTVRKGTAAEFAAALIVATTQDEDGLPLFLPSDIPALVRKSDRALNRVSDVALRLNKMGRYANDTVKNSAAPAPDGSLTA